MQNLTLWCTVYYMHPLVVHVSPFHSRYVMLGFVRNMKIFCSVDLFWFKSYWSRDILHGNFRLLFGNSMVVIQTLFTNLTPLCHICWMVCLLTMTYSMTSFQLFGVNRARWIVAVATRGARNAHSFRKTWFHSLRGVHDFTHSLYIHYVWLNLSVLWLCLRINDSDLFAWISLTDLSRTYFIIYMWPLLGRGKWFLGAGSKGEGARSTGEGAGNKGRKLGARGREKNPK